MEIQVIRYKPIDGRNSLKASVAVLLPEWGIEINNIAMHENEGKRWFQIPGAGKPFLVFQNKLDFQNFQVSTTAALDKFLKRGGSNDGADT